jgi:hypothetical protein
LFEKPVAKHFEFCHTNVNSQEMHGGVDEYANYEACFCKIKVCLTQLHGKNCMIMHDAHKNA